MVTMNAHGTNDGQSIKASDNSLNAWSTHVDGAAAIVCSRGSEQFSDPQSLSLFRAARTQMVQLTDTRVSLHALTLRR